MHRNRSIAVAITAVFLFTSLVVASGCQGEMKGENSSELPSYAYNSEETLSAYKISQEIPDILAESACYCGCGETQGHENLKDCFLGDDGEFIDHASNCHVCAIEAIDVSVWHEEGFSPDQISTKIDAKYHEYGNPTQKKPKQEFQTGTEFEGGPRIIFMEESADMGEMTLETSRDYSFRFKNTGDEPLQITDVRVKALKGC